MRNSNLVAREILVAIVALILLCTTVDASQVAVATFDRDPSNSSFAGRIGIASRVSTLINTPVRDHDGHKLGKIQDLFLDLGSGQVLCVMVAQGGSGTSVAVPAKSFLSACASGSTLEVQKQNLSDAPRCPGAADSAALLNLLPDSSAYFGQRNPSISKINPAQTCKSSELIGQHVKNQADEQLGTVVNLIVDVPTGHLIFAVISFAGGGTDLYAVPPAALQLTSDRTGLVINAVKAKIASLAESDSFFWANLAELHSAANIYRTFGQEPEFDSAATTGSDPAHEQVRAKVEDAPGANPEPPKTDSQIQRDILTAMMRDDVNNAIAMQRVKIGCTDGHVTLTGRVKNEKMRSKVNAIVASVVGSANMTDHLDLP